MKRPRSAAAVRSVHRRGGRLAAWFALSVLGLAASCGTDAQGVEDCRSIEQARCHAAAACGQISDVSACTRFYRDHCLHGLSVPAPGGPFTKACVQAIREAGDCASATGDAVAASCSRFGSQTRACKLVQMPESISACSFLVPNAPPIAEGGSGGMGGDAGDPAGSGGMSVSQGGSSGGTAPLGGSAGADPTPQGGSAGDTTALGGSAGAEPAPQGGSSGDASTPGAGAGGVGGAG
ncbi:MAG: hypothetical protein ACOY0T_10945 [Myxococcota bacterium]